MNKVFNWVFGSFFRTFGRVLVYIFIGFILFKFINLNDIKLPKFTDLIFMNVNAATETYTFNGSKIANKDFGSAYDWIGLTADTFNTLTFNLKLDYNYYYGELDSGPIGANELVNVLFISCTNPLHPISGLYSSYYNFLDLNYVSSDSCAWSWENTPTGKVQYTFARLKPTSTGYDYIDTTDGTISNFWYNFNNQSFGIQGISYNSSIYFTDIKYYTSSEYNELLSKYKQMREQQINTQAQIDNANQNTTDIINNQNSNTQAQIDNQNSNTDREIESQKVCNQFISNSSNIEHNSGYIRADGTINASNNYYYSQYLDIEENITIRFNNINNWPALHICYYNDTKNLISCNNYANIYNNNSKDITPTNTKYLRFSVFNTTNYPSIEYDICKNGNQAIGDGLNDINNSLTDDSPPTNLDSLNNSAGWLPAGPVDSILNLPLSFLTNLNTNLSKSCQPVNLPLPFINKNLPLPCVNTLYNEIDGLPNWINIIGTIASAFILFGYFINLYKYIDDTLTFRENNYIDNWSGV